MATTFDPGGISGNVVLSNGNLTMAAGSVTDGNAQATKPLYGKVYFEALFPTVGAGSSVGVCLRQTDKGGSIVGVDSYGLAWRKDGLVRCANATVTTIQTFTSNDRCCVAVDPSAALIWFRTNAGNWNNNVAADPATGANGISLSSMIGGGLLCLVPIVGTNAGSLTCNIYLASASWAQAAPSGFGDIDSYALPSFQRVNKKYSSAVYTPPAFAGANGDLPVTPGNPTSAKTVSGTVTLDGAAIAGKVVIAIDERSGRYLGRATSDVNGYYSIPCGQATLVTLVALGDGVNYNDLVLGQVVPA